MEKVKILSPIINKNTVLPLSLQPISAGFPSPAEDALEGRLDLNDLIVHPAATFFVKVEGTSMKDANILPGDLLIIDRSISPADGKIVVAILNGEFTLKRLSIQKKKVSLKPENPAYSPILISKEDDFQVWGVVTYIIHAAR